jgi:hypothetical protein
MKTFLIFLFFITSAQASLTKPDRGLYICEHGNEESICDQILKPIFSGNKLSAISVEYVGWCGSMGPYMYACENDICEDEGLKFEFRDSKHYRWENKQYKIHCEFAKK